MTTFTAKRVGHSHTIVLNDSPENLFHLFTPEGEKKWAEGWDFTPVFPSTREVEENMVFTTAAHDHGQMDAIWIITRYEPMAYSIEYQRIEPGMKIGRIHVRLTETPPGRTSATVEYVYTALSQEGNEFVEGFSEIGYQHFIQLWQNAIHHYLHTGKTPHHP